ncbi:hypothetical protein FQR65_LT13599 [Abscondita terminalis]|nr:hypothetical protein FQR65_LT13599 [Abscondita terminalis]
MEIIALSVGVGVFLIFGFIQNVIDIYVHLEKLSNFVLFIFFFLIYQFSLPIVVIFIVMFWMYRKIIGLILRIKVGNDFYTMVKDFDVMHGIDDPKLSIVYIFLKLKCDKNDGNNLVQILKNSIHKNHEQYQNVFQHFYCTLEKWMGYLYYKKNQITVDDFVLKLPVNPNVEELDHQQLMNLFIDCYDIPLPLNGTMLWDMLVGTQLVKDDVGSEKFYPVLFRVHHIMGDATALIEFLIRTLADGRVQFVECAPNLAKYLDREQNVCKNVARFILNACNTFILFPSLMFTAWFLKRDKPKHIFGEHLVGNKILWYSDDKGGKYFRKVKAIRKKCYQNTFSEIIVTAFWASLYDYCVTTHGPKVLALVPLPFMRLILSYFRGTMVFSSVPGSPKLIFNKGSVEISNCILWNAYLIDTNFHFTISTYNNQLALSFNGHTGFGFDEDGISCIIKDTYKNIELLENEIAMLN